MKLEGKTNQELLAMRAELEGDPANRNPAGSLMIFNQKTQRKLDAITRQITHNMAEKRRLDGNPVPCCGYSGRQQNKRR